MSQWYAKTAGQTLSELDARRSGLSPRRPRTGWSGTAPTSWPELRKNPCGPGFWTRCGTP